MHFIKGRSLHTSQVAYLARSYPGFCSMKWLGVFLLSLDGMVVHRRVTPSVKFTSTHLYTWVERGTVRVKCLAQEHNTMYQATAQTQTARSGVERTNHEVTVHPTKGSRSTKKILTTNKLFFSYHGYQNMFPVLHQEDICLVHNNNFNGWKKVILIGLLSINKSQQALNTDNVTTLKLVKGVSF